MPSKFCCSPKKSVPWFSHPSKNSVDHGLSDLRSKNNAKTLFLPLSLFVYLCIDIFLCGFVYGGRLSVNKKGSASTKAGKAPTKKGKATKDPNKPKRPASAFFVFM